MRHITFSYSLLNLYLIHVPIPNIFCMQEQQAGPESLLFEDGMKVEAKDLQNPSLICVATIQDIKQGKLLIHFDGWSSKYDYWCESTSTDIHPPMWCGKHGKKVQPPKGTLYNSYIYTPSHNMCVITNCNV